jgi:hypothetical protein
MLRSAAPHPKDSTSPAARLHDVLVQNEQTGVQWRAARGAIDGGHIVVTSTRATRPPADLFDEPRRTYTIVARDGGERVRNFAHTRHLPERSEPPVRYVFG